MAKFEGPFFDRLISDEVKRGLIRGFVMRYVDSIVNGNRIGGQYADYTKERRSFAGLDIGSIDLTGSQEYDDRTVRMLEDIKFVVGDDHIEAQFKDTPQPAEVPLSSELWENQTARFSLRGIGITKLQAERYIKEMGFGRG